MIFRIFSILILTCSALTALSQSETFKSDHTATIQPCSEYPGYWMYKGRPLLLLGGSNEDNLFQDPSLTNQLNKLQAAGGNYVRCTMSSRDPGDVWAFYYNDTVALYDLDRWNDAYWDRFGFFLEETFRRDIIVQIELWATFDFYRENWGVNPFNPKNNLNYSPDRVKLPTTISTHPIYRDNPFFWSVPNADNNIRLLEYQQAFIDKVLSYTLPYPHILYCIDNETSVTASWGAFWSSYIKKIASEKGKTIYATEMWDPWDLNHLTHRETFDQPDLYDFVEISQNNHQIGVDHWRNGLKQINRLRGRGDLRPFTSVKVYGGEEGGHGGGAQNGIESFVRNAFLGVSAVRFHRPPHGLGINDTASNVIKSLRLLVDSTDFLRALTVDHHNLSDGLNVAYERTLLDKTRILYFPNGGTYRLNSQGQWNLRVIKLLSSEWLDGGIQSLEELSSDTSHMIFILGSTD